MASSRQGSLIRHAPVVSEKTSGAWTAVLKSASLGAGLAAGAYSMMVAIEFSDFAWLGWLSLLPLLLSIRLLSPVRSAAAGAFWGLSFFVFCATSDHSPFTPTFWSALMLAGIPGVYGAIGAKITRQIGFSPLILALGWVGVEFALRPLAFEHGLLSGTQDDGLLFRLLGSLTGYALVAFLVAYVTASILSVLGDVCRWVRSEGPVRVCGALLQRFEAVEPFLSVGCSISSWRPRGPPLLVESRVTRRGRVLR